MTSIYSKDDKVEFIFTTFETYQISLNIYFSREKKSKKHFYFLKIFFKYNLANNKREIKKINYFGKFFPDV